MKKIFTTCMLIGAVALYAGAKELNESEAMKIAQKFYAGTSTQMRATMSDNALTTAYTARNAQNENLLYVFNHSSDNGFVIVAGDDLVEQKVLGYSDTGSFDYDNVPENMRQWLGEYAREIEQARISGNIAQQRAKSEAYVSKFNKNVGPLVEARWSQDAPYNNMCPIYNGTLRSATGCVATAMAQIMYHHKYPEHGVGSKDIYVDNQIETIDFAGTTYLWDTMTPVYSSLSSEAECDAVATLMYHVGRSVDMMYGAASGAVSAESARAWATYWDYDKAVVHRDRSFYTIEEWETMIMEEIDNSRPLLYHGQSEDGGHAFVLDGYNSDGYVHINWGWNGMSNGYFLLQALTPEKQGIGGFSGGYNSGQGAVFGIQPNKGNKATIEITANSMTVATDMTYTPGEMIANTVSGIANAGWSVAAFSAGYMIYDESNNLVECIESCNLTIDAGSSLGTQNIPMTLPATLADGTYHIYLAHTDENGDWKRVAMNTNSAPYHVFSVANNEITFTSEEEGEIWATSVVCNEENIYSKRFSTFTITMSNTMNHEYYGSIYVSIYNSSGRFEQRKSSPIALSIPAGKEITLEIPIKIEVNKGDYCIFITDGNKNKFSDSYPITVLPEPELAELKVSNFTLTSTAKDLLQAEYTVTNNGGDYTGCLRSWLQFSNRQSTSSYINTEEITLKQGDSLDIKQTWKFDDGVVGETYICTLWYEDNRNGGMSQLGTEEVSFILKEETGIDMVATDCCTVYPNPAQEYICIEANVAIEHITLYNMQGAAVLNVANTGNRATLSVTSLAAGNYIIIATTKQGCIIKKVVIL